MNQSGRTDIVIGGGYKHYEIIDFLKGFSILMIVLMHLIQTYMTYMPRIIKLCTAIGGTGVHIFIFCSGFGLCLSQLRREKTFVRFLQVKFINVYFPYICIVIISSAIPFMYKNSDRICALLSHIFLYKMFIPSYVSSFGGQLWFISVIIQLYLLFIPLVLFKKRVSHKFFFMICLVLSVAWWIIIVLMGKDDVRTYNSFCLQYLWEFALGICVAEYLYSGKDISLNRTTLFVFAIVGIGLEGIMGIQGGMLTVLNDIPAFCGYSSFTLFLYSVVCENLSVLDSGRFNLLFSLKRALRNIILALHSISYEWYLVHILVFEIVFQLVQSRSLFMDCVLGVISFLASISVAYGYSILIKNVKNKLFISDINN